MTYAQKFKDPRWQKKRLKILERDNFECQICFDEKSTLHIHHYIYIKEREPWEYSDELLVTLCEDCHEFIKEVDLKSLIAEHILIYGANKAIRWFIKRKELANNVSNFENNGYKSIADAFNEYSDWIKLSKGK